MKRLPGGSFRRWHRQSSPSRKEKNRWPAREAILGGPQFCRRQLLAQAQIKKQPLQGLFSSLLHRQRRPWSRAFSRWQLSPISRAEQHKPSISRSSRSLSVAGLPTPDASSSAASRAHHRPSPGVAASVALLSRLCLPLPTYPATAQNEALKSRRSVIQRSEAIETCRAVIVLCMANRRRENGRKVPSPNINTPHRGRPPSNNSSRPASLARPGSRVAKTAARCQSE